MAKAPLTVKSKSSQQLQNVLDGVPNSDFLILVGDFNARVGVFNPQDELRHGVVSKHGIKERNLAGEEYLQFCECNQLSIINTCFQKKLIYYGTWMHPAP